MTNAVTTLALAVDSTQVKAASTALDQFAQKGTAAEKAAAALQKATQGANQPAAAAAAAYKDLTKQQTEQANAARAAAMGTEQVGRSVGRFVAQIALGHDPMTALAHQGTQLAGALTADASAAGAATALFNPLTLALGAVGIAAGAAYLASKQLADEQKEIAIAIARAGGAFGATTSQITGYAQEVARQTGTVGQAMDALSQIIATGAVQGGADLKRFAAVAVESHKLLGTEVGDTVKAFTALGKDPVRASLQLNDTTKFLTASLYEQIRALQASGQQAAAASLAQNAYADAQQRVLSVAKENLTAVERAWLAVGNRAKWAWDQMLGRPKGLKEQLDEVEQQIANRRKFSLSDFLFDRSTPQLQEQAQTIRESMRLQQRAIDAAAEAQRAEQDKQDEESSSRESARASIARAAAQLQLAQLQADLERQRVMRELAFERGKIDAKAYHDELLRLDTAEINAQIANIDRLKTAESLRRPTNKDEELSQAAALIQLDTQRAQLQARLTQRQVEEEISKAQVTKASAAYVQQLRDEAEARERQHALQLVSIDLSDKEREALQRRKQIEEQFLSESRRLRDQNAAGQIEPAVYAQRLQEC